MPQKNKEQKDSAFKNWINSAVVKKMAIHIHRHVSKFDKASFCKVSDQLPALELKARVELISAALYDHLPKDYERALKILMLATSKPKTGQPSLQGFELWPVTTFIEKYGLESPEHSLSALYQLTQKFTAEFAIRPFILKNPKGTLKVLQKWADDPNHHVRRLVSEGSRPRLPWGLRLKFLIEDPSPTLPLLESLKYDEELYVRKSVANHLNDISKDHPDLVVKIAKQWLQKAPAKHQKKIQWIVRHSLRSLLKAGHPEALKLLGYHVPGKIEISKLKLSKKNLKMGETLEFSFSLASSAEADLMIDYIIHHVKSNGKHSAKVFKLSIKKVMPELAYEIRKKHAFKKITTRTYFSGKHYLEIMINGKIMNRTSFHFSAD